MNQVSSYRENDNPGSSQASLMTQTRVFLMVELGDLAGRLLKYELQLEAYQKLHADEIAQLWQALDACKREIVAALPSERTNGFIPTGMSSKQPGQKGESQGEAPSLNSRDHD
jgi:hypothetical protein